MKEVTHVAVYGTLRKGHRNHAFFLKNAKFVREGVLSGYALLDYKTFPGIFPTKDEAHEVVCEVYEINQHILGDLDRLEGIKQDLFYREIVTWDDGLEAHVYVLHPKQFFNCCSKHESPKEWLLSLDGDYAQNDWIEADLGDLRGIIELDYLRQAVSYTYGDKVGRFFNKEPKPTSVLKTLPAPKEPKPAPAPDDNDENDDYLMDGDNLIRLGPEAIESQGIGA